MCDFKLSSRSWVHWWHWQGALDGLRYSNTYFLERALGWRGVLIEASPSSYTALTRNRPNQLCLHAAVCEVGQVVHYADRGSSCCRGIAEFMSPTFKKLHHPGLVSGDYSGLAPVRCEPLPVLLGPFNIQHINFFSLDVEGGELSILRVRCVQELVLFFAIALCLAKSPVSASLLRVTPWLAELLPVTR